MSELIPIENQYTELLERTGLTLWRGINQDVLETLVNGAQQSHVLSSTPLDAAERFTDFQAAEKWVDRVNPTVYTLGRKAIGGVIWFHPFALEGSKAQYTFAIRMYEALRGQRLAGRFMEAAHEDLYNAVYGGNTWLRTQANNNDMTVELYERYGYVRHGLEGDRLIMVRNPRRIHQELQQQYEESHDLNDL